MKTTSFPCIIKQGSLSTNTIFIPSISPVSTDDFSSKKFPVNVWVRDLQKKEKYVDVIKNDIDSLVENGLFTREKGESIITLINFTDSIEDAVKDVQLIHETIAEDLEMKQNSITKTKLILLFTY